MTKEKIQRDRIASLYKKYELEENHVFNHKHYLIITRPGIDKIQAKENISIHYDAIKCEPEFCCVKATGTKGIVTVQTFGSAKYGGKEWDKTKNKDAGGWIEHGNTSTWYLMEMAEKRAMSRVVLKLTGFYEKGVFSEDEFTDIDEPMTFEQGNIIETLLLSASIEGKLEKDIYNAIQDNSMGFQKAKECIVYLKDNQVTGDNMPRQKDIKKHMETFTQTDNSIKNKV